jgi:hypothetical protein
VHPCEKNSGPGITSFESQTGGHDWRQSLTGWGMTEGGSGSESAEDAGGKGGHPPGDPEAGHKLLRHASAGQTRGVWEE